MKRISFEKYVGVLRWHIQPYCKPRRCTELSTEHTDMMEINVILFTWERIHVVSASKIFRIYLPYLG